MPRRKYPNKEDQLSKLVGVRLKEKAYNKFKAMLLNTNCQTVGELLRVIATHQKIFFYYKDASLDLPMHELSLIRKQITAIGYNINQITHHFHQAERTTEKLVLALKIQEEYKKVGKKVDELMDFTSDLAKKRLSQETIRAGFNLEEFKILRVPPDFNESSNKS